MTTHGACMKPLLILALGAALGAGGCGTSVDGAVAAELTRAMTGAVSAAGGQDESAPGLPGIASFEHAPSWSAVLLVAVLSFVSLGMGLGVIFTRRPATVQLTPVDPESGLHRAQRAVAVASARSTGI